MKIYPHIFRANDIRGLIDTELSEEFAYFLGRAYGSKAKEAGAKLVAIGRDCRLSSEPYSLKLAKGIAEEGVNVELIGMGPTPQLYFSIFHRDLDGGIQVTGSHNPADMNGFKICLGKMALSGDDVQDLLKRIHSVLKLKEEGKDVLKEQASITENPIHDEYVSMLIEKSKPYLGKRKLKVVVDAGNGVGGMVGPKVLRALGVEVTELFCEPDGTFPNHHPDPTVEESIEILKLKVKEVGADFGVGWDGDADRIGLVDENGEVIWGDMLLLILAREIMKEIPSPTVIGEVKCSSLLYNDLAKRGAKPIMWKTGHALIKSKLKETHAELAGEMSGHIFFAHRYFGFDDAIYATLRFLEVVSKTDKKVSELLADLPKVVSTPELRVDCPDNIKFEIANLAKKAFAEYEVETIDGVRINFEKGWGLVRASNTQPILVMRFEAETKEDLLKYEKIVREKVAEIQAGME